MTAFWGLGPMGSRSRRRPAKPGVNSQQRSTGPAPNSSDTFVQGRETISSLSSRERAAGYRRTSDFILSQPRTRTSVSVSWNLPLAASGLALHLANDAPLAQLQIRGGVQLERSSRSEEFSRLMPGRFGLVLWRGDLNAVFPAARARWASTRGNDVELRGRGWQRKRGPSVQRGDGRLCQHAGQIVLAEGFQKSR